MRALVLALGLIATPAMAADQFDLVCKGRYHERLHAKWKPLEVRFKIDTTAGAWCRDRCTEIRSIATVEPGKLTLSRSDPSDNVSPFAYQEIDRLSGAFKSYMSGGGSFWEEEAACTVAPFTGFPAAKF